MKNTQLRTGNLVISNGVDRTIDAVSRGHVCFTEDIPNEKSYGEWISLDEVEFIPINEKYLSELGFVSSGCGYWDIELETNLVLSYYICIRINDGPQYCGMSNKNTNIDLHRFPHIKYVHQLQNLYFIWKNEELTIKKDE